MKKNILFCWIFLLLLMNISCEHSPPKVIENPLKDIKRGLWVLVSSFTVRGVDVVDGISSFVPSRYEVAEIGIELDSSNVAKKDTIFYKMPPAWIVNDDISELTPCEHITIGYDVVQDEKGQWKLLYFKSVSLEINESKDTLTFSYKDKNDRYISIDYVYLLNRSEAKGTSLANLMAKLEGFTYRTSLEKGYFISFFRKPNLVCEKEPYSKIVTYPSLVHRKSNEWTTLSENRIGLYSVDIYFFLEAVLNNGDRIYSVLKEVDESLDSLTFLPINGSIRKPLTLYKVKEKIPYLDSIAADYQELLKGAQEWITFRDSIEALYGDNFKEKQLKPIQKN